MYESATTTSYAVVSALSYALHVQVTASSSSETSRKGLYALAALLRNNADARSQFYSNSGLHQLTEVLTVQDQTQQVQLKILNLVTDLSQLDLSAQVMFTTSMHDQ